MTRYYYLRVTEEVAKELNEVHGFGITDDASIYASNRSYAVYPNANWIHIRSKSTCDEEYAPCLSIEQVFALKLLDNQSWNNYLLAEFPDVPTY